MWTNHIKDDKEKLEFEQQVLRAKPVLDRLKFLVEQKEDELNRYEDSLVQYDNNNWAFRQAHQNGFRSCQSRVLKLIDLDQKDNKQK